MAEEQADQQIEVPTTKDEATDVPVGAEQPDTEEAQKKLNKDIFNGGMDLNISKN